MEGVGKGSCGNGDSAAKRERRRRRKESGFICEASCQQSAGPRQVASSFIPGSACADSVSLLIQRKRKKKRRLKHLQHGRHLHELSPGECSSEKEKKSLLEWVEMCMKPEHDGNAMKDFEVDFGNGQLAKAGFSGRYLDGHGHVASVRNGDSSIEEVCIPAPGNVCGKVNLSNGHSNVKDRCACNGDLANEGEVVVACHSHTFKSSDTGIMREVGCSQVIAHKNKRKREVDKVLDYVLKRCIVVKNPSNESVSVRPQTRKTIVIAWGRSIPVTLTSDASTIEEWISSQNGDLFGLDVEWRPNRAKGQQNKVALLQLSNENECLIIQLLFLNRQPQALRELLLDPSKGLAGVGVLADGKRLLQDYGLECQGGIELTTLAVERLKRDELRNVGLKVLMQEVLGLALEKPKRVTLSNWAKVKLDQAQINYACMDAWASYALSKRLLVHTLNGAC